MHGLQIDNGCLSHTSGCFNGASTVRRPNPCQPNSAVLCPGLARHACCRRTRSCCSVHKRHKFRKLFLSFTCNTTHPNHAMTANLVPPSSASLPIVVRTRVPPLFSLSPLQLPAINRCLCSAGLPGPCCETSVGGYIANVHLSEAGYTMIGWVPSQQALMGSYLSSSGVCGTSV